jgi:hypothetical protein
MVMRDALLRWEEDRDDCVIHGRYSRVGERPAPRRGARDRSEALCRSSVREAAMLIRQTLNFGAHLVTGAILGALAVVAMRGYRHASHDRLEPRYPSEPPSTPQAREPPGGAAAI